MEVLKVEIVIVNHDNVDAQEIVDIFESRSMYPNDCISPRVIGIDSRKIDYTDDHPLNSRDGGKVLESFTRLFDE